jgi:hypothetical protein
MTPVRRHPAVSVRRTLRSGTTDTPFGDFIDDHNRTGKHDVTDYD